MTSRITGFYINPETDTAEVRTVDNTLAAFYKLLGCSSIEMVERTIGTRRRTARTFYVLCDEEGALVDDPKISAINDLGDPMLVGPLFIVKGDDLTPEFTSLTVEELDFIRRHVHHLSTRNHPEGWHMLTCCKYPQ